jgi:CheY-like chemotaxis protein
MAPTYASDERQVERQSPMAHPETALFRDAPVVLVIDDDHSFCVFMAKLIRSLGYEVMTTTDPTTTALYQLSASDIVFIDILMPAMDGFEVLKTLSSQGAKCAIVLMSGSDDRLARAEIMAHQLGLRLIGVLHKPFRLADLQGILGAKR